MGEAFVAQGGDLGAVSGNPAGLAFGTSNEVFFTYGRNIQDTDQQFLAWALGLYGTRLGGSVNIYSTPKTEITDFNGDSTGEYFQYKGTCYGFSLAQNIRGRLGLGITLKTVQDEIFGSRASTFATDFGSLVSLGKWKLGASLENLGGEIDDGVKLPRTVRAGIGYTYSGFSLLSQFRRNLVEKQDSLDFGAEYGRGNMLGDMMFLRMGYKTEENSGGFSAGLGINLVGLKIDYAWIPHESLGSSHRISTSYSFGQGGGKQKEAIAPVETPVESPAVVSQAAVNTAPELLWTGEENYASVGLSTGAGNTGTIFVYRVKYVDADNDVPASGYPKVHITKGGVEISGSPFVMEYISGENRTGVVYAYSTTLPAGNDYACYFEAKDSSGTAAAGAPVIPVNGPMVAQLEAVKMSGGTNVAVAEFIGKNVSQADASIVADFVRTELVNTGLFNVMDRNNMDSILAEQKFQGSGCTEQQCAVEIGKLLNVKQMIVGSLSKLLDTYYITLNVVDVETGKITASYDSNASSSLELRDACKKIVEKLSRQ